MVEEIGINVIVPILVFLVIIVGAYMISNEALVDVLERRAADK